ncbi:MAG: hypothetical protein [Caudoviricetes sp.]|nr:MAG: hypothetical protein [Caudoviricetes sp.]
MTCSQWCYQKWEQALEAGNEEEATNYMQLYELWMSRSM